jgi:hypothetical protein
MRVLFSAAYPRGRKIGAQAGIALFDGPLLR